MYYKKNYLKFFMQKKAKISEQYYTIPNYYFTGKVNMRTKTIIKNSF